MKRQATTQLPRFVVGAIATAGASVASGATVQISFDNNVVSTSTGLTNFLGDLTGDGVEDAVGEIRAGGFGYLSMIMGAEKEKVASAGAFAGSMFGPGGNFVWMNRDAVQVPLGSTAEIRGVTKVSFSDSWINTGGLSGGWLDVTARSGSDGVSFQIHRLIFDDASLNVAEGITASSTGITDVTHIYHIPEPSSLGLLALGAGGLMMRRRRSQAA